MMIESKEYNNINVKETNNSKFLDFVD